MSPLELTQCEAWAEVNRASHVTDHHALAAGFPGDSDRSITERTQPKKGKYVCISVCMWGCVKVFECIFRSVRGVKRTGMQDKRAITSYFRFAQRRRLPMFTAQALASNTCSGPKTWGGVLQGLPTGFTGDWGRSAEFEPKQHLQG